MKLTKDVEMPRRSRRGDAGYDFYLPEDVVFKRGQKVTIDTGVAFDEGDIPDGCVMLLFPRSSLGSKYGLAFVNTVGVIDSQYRDTVKAPMHLLDPSVGRLRLEKGTRFMQGVIVPFVTMPNEIEPTEERKGGFGSTGV